MKKQIVFYSCIFILAIIVFGANTVFAERESVLDIQEVKSQGGITAWLVEDHSVPVIALDFAFIGAGAQNDPADKQGLARMLSNTMDEGAGELDSQAFQKELRDLSISLGFNTDRDNFGGSVKTLTKNKARAFELLKLALTKPRFDEEPIARMRQANQSRIRSSLSDPNWMAARIMNDKAFAGHPYAQNSGGTLGSLETIKAEDLKAFMAAQFSKGRLRVAAAGDISAEELKTLLDDIFGSLPDKVETKDIPDTKLQNEGTTFVYTQAGLPQTVVEIMQPGISKKDPDYQKAQIMNFVLGSSGFGSRLTEEIREKRGLTYGIYSSFLNMEHFNALTISTSTNNQNVGELLKLTTEELNKLRSYEITAKELEDAKAYLIGALPLSLTSTDKISSLLLSMQMDDLPIDYLDKREKEIQSATTADVFAVAQKILKPENFITVLVGNPQDVIDAQSIETLPNAE